MRTEDASLIHFDWRAPAIWPHAFAETSAPVETSTDEAEVTCPSCRHALGTQQEEPEPFWNRLGLTGDLPTHLPIGVNRLGQGPVPRPHHYTCWCANPTCPLTLALREQRRVTVAQISVTHITRGPDHA